MASFEFAPAAARHHLDDTSGDGHLGLRAFGRCDRKQLASPVNLLGCASTAEFEERCWMPRRASPTQVSESLVVFISILERSFAPARSRWQNGVRGSFSRRMWVYEWLGIEPEVEGGRRAVLCICRVSSRAQMTSLEKQKELTTAYAAEHGRPIQSGPGSNPGKGVAWGAIADGYRFSSVGAVFSAWRPFGRAPMTRPTNHVDRTGGSPPLGSRPFCEYSLGSCCPDSHGGYGSSRLDGDP